PYAGPVDSIFAETFDVIVVLECSARADAFDLFFGPFVRIAIRQPRIARTAQAGSHRIIEGAVVEREMALVGGDAYEAVVRLRARPKLIGDDEGRIEFQARRPLAGHKLHALDRTLSVGVSVVLHHRPVPAE